MRGVIGIVLAAGAVLMGVVVVAWAIGREQDRIPIGIRQMVDEQRVRGADAWRPYPHGDADWADAVDHGVVEGL